MSIIGIQSHSTDYHSNEKDMTLASIFHRRGAVNALWSSFLVVVATVRVQGQQGPGITPVTPCEGVKAQFPKAAFKDLDFKYDDVTGSRTVSTKGPSLASSTVWEPLLLSEASPDSANYGVPVLQYKHTTFLMTKSEQTRPVLNEQISFFLLVDTVRFVLPAIPGTYRISELRPSALVAGIVYETLRFFLPPHVLASIADGKRIRMKAGEIEVKFDGNRLIRGAQGLLLGQSCGWPRNPG